MSLDVVSKTNSLLNKQHEDAPSERIEPRRNRLITSGAVWLCLDEGNVYDAAKVLSYQ